jgi:hypothetical protein
LLTLSPMLDRLLSRRGEIAYVGPLPLVSGERRLDPVLPVTSLQSANLAVPATPFFAPVPNLPPAEPPLIGRSAKTPIAEYVPPLQPAIAPPSDALVTLRAVTGFLATAQAAFPAGTRFVDSSEMARVLERDAYGLYLQRRMYTKFLSQSNTGIALVLPVGAYHPNSLSNRLEPKVADSFSPLFQYPQEGRQNLQGSPSFVPRLLLSVADGQFRVVEEGLDYGFLVDLGDVPLEKLDRQLQGVSPRIRQFFLTYHPPKQLEELQVDRRRFLTGKLEGFHLNELVLSRAPVQIHHTYLLRLFQFRLPQAVLTGEPVSRSQRRYLDRLLELRSSDVSIAFCPVVSRADGGYVVLWKVLGRFPDPQIEDLERYVNLE